MPRKPKRPCAYPGCPELVDGGYCEKHKKLVTEQYNKYGRDDFTKNFYKSPAWIICRKKHLEEQPFCVECLKKGKTVKATMVDHIVPIKDGGSRYDNSNLQSLCWSCHSRKSVEEGSRFGTRPHEYNRKNWGQGESNLYKYALYSGAAKPCKFSQNQKSNAKRVKRLVKA